MRAGDKVPVYYSRFVTRADDERFTDVASMRAKARFVTNERMSWSGFTLPREYLRKQHNACINSFFASMTFSGSHEASLDAVVAGDADVAVVDSVVYDMWRAQHADDGVAARVHAVDTPVGPTTMPPALASSRLSPYIRRELSMTMLRAGVSKEPEDAEGAAILAKYGFERFSQVTPRSYLPFARVYYELNQDENGCADDGDESAGEKPPAHFPESLVEAARCVLCGETTSFACSGCGDAPLCIRGGGGLANCFKNMHTLNTSR